MTIEYRSADGGAEGLPELAADLVRRQVAVIFASGPPCGARGQARDADHPDRVRERWGPRSNGSGLRASIGPSGNVTGFYFLATELVAKRLALLHELLPGPRALPCSSIRAMRQQPSQPCGTSQSSAARSVSTSKSITSAPRGELDAAFAAFSSWRAEALFVAPDPFFNTERAQLVRLGSSPCASRDPTSSAIS